MTSQPTQFFCFPLPRPTVLKAWWRAAALLGLAMASAVSAQSLEQLARNVAEEHPRIRQQRAEAEAAQHDVERVMGKNGLRLAAFVEPGRAYTVVGNAASVSSSDMGMRATYPIYDWGKAGAEASQASARLDAVKAKVDAEIIGQWTKLSDLYVDVLRNENLLGVTHQYAEALQALRDKVQEIVLVDKGRLVDLQQVDNRLQQAQLQALQRETASSEALIQLRALTNLPTVRVFPLEDVSDKLPLLDQARSVWLDRHPAVLEAQYQAKEAEQAVYLANAQEKPAFDLQVSVGSRSASGRFDAFQSADVRFVSQWDLYNGGTTKATSMAAGKRMLATKEQMGAVRHDLASEIDRIWSRRQHLRSRVESWKQQIDGAMKLHNAYWEQFRAGRRTVLDLLSIENDIYQARLSDAAERHDLLQSGYRLFIQLGHAGARWLPSDAASVPSPRSSESNVWSDGQGVRDIALGVADDLRGLANLAAARFALRWNHADTDAPKGLSLKLSVEMSVKPEAVLARATIPALE